MNNGHPGRRGDSEGPPTQVQSVDRALTILEYLAEHGSSGVTEIAKSLDVHKSTLIRLAGATSAQLDLTKVWRPVCVRLAGEFGETVNIAVLDSESAINITQEHGSTVVATRNWVGKRTPLHATSSGKMLLAYDTGGTLAKLLAAGLERFTKQTITEGVSFDAKVTTARARDWACCSEELEIGLNSVAAPIFSGDGEAIASVSVSGPSYRLTATDFPSIAERLLAGADEISVRLGYFPRR